MKRPCLCWVAGCLLALVIAPTSVRAKAVLVTGPISTVDGAELLWIVSQEIQRRIDRWDTSLGAFDEVLVFPQEGPLSRSSHASSPSRSLEGLELLSEGRLLESLSNGLIGLVVKTDAISCNEVDESTRFRVPTLAIGSYRRFRQMSEDCFFPWVHFEWTGFKSGEEPRFLRSIPSLAIQEPDRVQESSSTLADQLRQRIADLETLEASEDQDEDYEKISFSDSLHAELSGIGESLSHLIYASGEQSKQIHFIQERLRMRVDRGEGTVHRAFFAPADFAGQTLCSPSHYMDYLAGFSEAASPGSIEVSFHQYVDGDEPRWVTNTLPVLSERPDVWLHLFCGQFSVIERKWVMLHSSSEALVSGFQELIDGIDASKTSIFHDPLGNPESKSFPIVDWLFQGVRLNGGFPTATRVKHVGEQVRHFSIRKGLSRKVLEHDFMQLVGAPKCLELDSQRDQFAGLAGGSIQISSGTYFLSASPQNSMVVEATRLVRQIPWVGSWFKSTECRNLIPAHSPLPPQFLCRVQ